MLNMNTYGPGSDIFKWGINLNVGTFGINKYVGGQKHFFVNFININSPSTGHMPFTLFDISYITGARWALGMTLLGVYVGPRRQNVVDDKGNPMPDKRVLYAGLSCFNKPSTKEEN